MGLFDTNVNNKRKVKKKSHTSNFFSGFSPKKFIEKSTKIK